MKVFTPKRKAEYSLQFYFDKCKVFNLRITSQGGDFSKESLNLYYFGTMVAENDLMYPLEKNGFRGFCQGYINRLDEIKRRTYEKERSSKKEKVVEKQEKRKANEKAEQL